MHDRWLFDFARPAAADIELIGFPHAGGGPAAFAHWPTALPPAVALGAVQLPGRGARIRETPIADRSALLDRLGPALETRLRRASAPVVFIGHSLGAALAFEACRWLAARGGPRPALLVVIAHRPPHQPLRGPALHTGDDRALLEELRRLGGTPGEVLDAPDLMRVLLPMLRADYTVAETWCPGAEAVVDVPIFAAGGWSDPDVQPAAIEGWRGHTRAAFDWAMFDGGHFFLHDRPGTLWAAIRRTFEQTARAGIAEADGSLARR